jgi:pyrimidine operon attenuation protein/uracil phosphoribosyltransferase
VAEHAADDIWSGSWVCDQLGIELRERPGHGGPSIKELAGLAVRRNPRRVHLLVSPVLAKHVPADPVQVLARATELGHAVQAALTGQAADLVVGYAETATGLGHAVAATLPAAYLHSTRRSSTGHSRWISFDEEHSHATRHHLDPTDLTLVQGTGPLVLVDDELTTGRTAMNTIRALRREGCLRTRFVIAALLDLRSDGDAAEMEVCADELGVRIDVVALGRGRIDLPDDVLQRGRTVVADLPVVEPSDAATGPVRPAKRLGAAWPADVAHHGRAGFALVDHARFDRALAGYVQQLAEEIGPGPLHVLGTEELMYLPVRLAAAIAAEMPTESITCSSTTRSPIAVVDEPGYAVRSVLTFAAHDCDDDSPRYAYNLAGTERILVVVDDESDEDRLAGPDGLLGRLAQTGAQVLTCVVPAHVAQVLPAPLRGPAFGSYPAADVGWLLTDLSDIGLESPAEEREEAIQSGAGHYAESLPIEYVPSGAYQQLYDEALAASAARVARCVGAVAELVLATRGPDVVLASLARAGTPVGILLRHWFADRHGLDVPHYTLSIVRGRGIDELALRWLAEKHDPARVVFVDGWTGKGMITRELAAAIRRVNELEGTAFSSELAVLADTGHCVELYGTRDDFLIPSACLNSTVSGLVSRTVLRPDLIAPNMFHGAKFYADLAPVDVSSSFVSAVRCLFADVAAEVAREVAALQATDRTPTWAGRKVVAEIGIRYGVTDENLIKPGVGEATRVLLRRTPWKVLIEEGARTEVPHLIQLAEERGVDVDEVRDLGYTAVGLIRPREHR